MWDSNSYYTQEKKIEILRPINFIPIDASIINDF